MSLLVRLALVAAGLTAPSTAVAADSSGPPLVSAEYGWFALGDSVPAPPAPAAYTLPRQLHTAVLDPALGRMILFGGSQNGTGVVANDLWLLSGSAGAIWEQRTLALAPSLRLGHTATVDPNRGRMIVFGGVGNGTYNDVHALTLDAAPAWSDLSPLGTPPAPRSGHSAIYDPIRDRLIIYGGRSATGEALTDVWALNLTPAPAWENLSPTGSPPPGREGHVAFYDSATDAMIVFGGRSGTAAFRDTWKLSLSGAPAWSSIVFAGATPTARYGASCVLDPFASRALVFGGHTATTILYNELWALTLTPAPTWTKLTPSGTPPAGRCYASMFVDPATSRAVIYGGAGQSETLCDGAYLTLGASPAWEVFTPFLAPPAAVTQAIGAVSANVPPPTMYGSSMVFDSGHDRMILFGGSNYNASVWTLELSPIGKEWILAYVIGSPPSGRYAHCAIYDPVRDRMIVYGGYNGAFLGDVWELRLTGTPTWAPLDVAGTPPSTRDYASAAYDPSRDRMIMFGGNRPGTFLNDVWALELSGTPQWTLLAPFGQPPTPRLCTAMSYDAPRDRMIFYGGYDIGASGEVWELQLWPGLFQWRLLAPAGIAPAARYCHSIVLDAVGDRLLMFAGTSIGWSRNDLWTLSLGSGEAWFQVPTSGTWPGERHVHAAAFDAERGRMIVFGGNRSLSSGSGGNLNDTWILQVPSLFTPVLASVSGADVLSDRVRLTWFASAPPSSVCGVMRREGSGAWIEPARLAFDGSGRLVFEDRGVRAGARYTYGLLAAGDTEPSALYEVEVPRGAALSLAGFARNPSLSSLAIRFSLADAAPAKLEVMDVAGRVVYREDVGALGAGSHVVDAGRATPGLYWIRLTRGDRVLTARGAVVR